MASGKRPNLREACSFLAAAALFLLSTVWKEATLYLGLIPALVVREGWVWQLVTYMFVHANITHILLNISPSSSSAARLRRAALRVF
jgi:membrane associated rhomboid family serine protease